MVSYDIDSRTEGDPLGNSALTISGGDVSISEGDLTVSGSITAASLTDRETVTDPDDAGTITPPTDGSNFICTITTVGADETRLLGTPTRVGQLGYIVFGTDGGDFTITNSAGWYGYVNRTVLTFTAVTNTAVLVAAGTAAATDWRVLALGGVTTGDGLAVVADPGDAGTMTAPADGSDYRCDITTAGSESRVLDTPTRLGQRLLVVFETDVGNFTITSAGIDDGADNTLTFDDAGDVAELEAMGTGAATDWRIRAKKGVAISTV